MASASAGTVGTAPWPRLSVRCSAHYRARVAATVSRIPAARACDFTLPTPRLHTERDPCSSVPCPSLCGPSEG